MRRALLLAGLVAGLVLGACRGVPHGEAPSDRGAGGGPDAGGPAVRVVWTRPFGSEGEVPAALVGAGPERLAALTDRALYLLDLEGRVLSRAPLPDAAAGPGGVSSLAWDGEGLGLALRWRGDGSLQPGTYLALTGAEGLLLESQLTPIAELSSPLRSAWDGEAHVVLWLRGPELHETRVPRGDAVGSRLLAGELAAGLALGELQARKGARELCTVEGDGTVSLRRFGPEGPGAVSLGSADRQALGPCRLASSGRTQLLGWKRRALAPRWPDGGSLDGSLRALSFDDAVAQVVSGPLASPALPLTAFEGTTRIEGAYWDGGRYVVLVAAAGFRGGRLLLTLVDEAGQLLARDLPVPIEVEPALLLPASLVVAGGDYLLLYGLRRPWDEGILYLARLRLEAPSLDAR